MTSNALRMIQFKKASDLRLYLEKQREKGRKIGFVPTMGALHEGHISLIHESAKNNQISVCSIFVNPTQFNDPSDLDKYPVTLEEDIRKLFQAGCDILFLPGIPEMYPDGTQLTKKYDLGYLETILEGSFRPGHFQGVVTIVHRLLEMVRPDNLYMGQKDYQQCMVIRELLRQTGLEKEIHLQIQPTRREADGLAMSSRNMRLLPDQRALAVSIYETLRFIKDNYTKTGFEQLKKEAEKRLTDLGFRVDYIEIADAATLLPVQNNDNGPLVALAAAFMGDVRLIDNLLLN